MRIVKQNRFKNLSELHKEWTEAGVKASRVTTHRRVKEFSYSCRISLVKPLLRRLTWAMKKKNWTVAKWSKVLFSDVESILLDNTHKSVLLSVGCASFSSTLFPSTQLSVNILGYSTL
uniref:Transposase Tc1-like domain-containing protein n=1 Tax=Cyprinus carpio carpio TaxID=630221 RepID=A0A9J8D7H1_CYPCA